MKKLITAAALLAALGATGCRSDKDPAVTYSGFPELSQGYRVARFGIPTKGHVKSIDMLPNTRYKKTSTPDSIKYEGPFQYTIWPEDKFMPKDPEDTDNRGNSPFGDKNEWNTYWSSVREGVVVLEPIRNRK